MLTAKIKACFLYYVDLLKVNLAFSLFTALVGLGGGLGFFTTFCCCLATGGPLLASFFYERNRGQQYYFFYNLGISKGMLYASVFLLNILAAVVLLVVKNNLL